MRVSEETITPKRASELLKAHLVPERQRKALPGTVRDYARAMRAGKWLLTHQGIAIDTQGELIDGQQRLMAIIEAGVPVKMLVAREVMSNGEEHGGMFAIDAVDRGRARSVGQQLQLRHGRTHGNLCAAACQTILMICCRSIGAPVGKNDTGKTLQVLSVYGKELDYCIDHQGQLPGLRSGLVLGAFAFAMRLYPEPIREAYLACMGGENIRRGDPMYALRSSLLNRAGAYNGGAPLVISRAVLSALRRVVTGETMQKVQSDGEIGLDFFVKKQQTTINKLLVACGYLEKA